MNNLTVFENQEFGKVRTVLKDGETWFVAKDVCDCLDVKNVSDAINMLDDDEKNTIVLNEGIGNPEKSIINESGLYSLVLSSRKPSAKKFKKWVTSEVLPSIRKTGGYVQENRAIDFVNNWLPSLDETSKNVIAGVIEENRKLQYKIETDKPLVDFAETISASSDSIDVGVFAKVIKDEGINIGRNKLFQWLREKGYLMDNNIPYQKAMDSGMFEVVEYSYKTPFGDKLATKTLVTGKGQIKLVQILKKEFNIKKK
jgi:anti-repressor protein